MLRRSQSLLVLPVLAIGLPGAAPADGGGASPLQPVSSVRVGLSDSSAVWGQTVVASGSGVRRSLGAVTVWIEVAGGRKQIIKAVRPSSRGVWAVRFVARAPGTVGATQGGVLAAVSASGGKRLSVSAQINATTSVPLSSSGHARVSAKVRPGGTWQWSVSRRTSGGVQLLASGRSAKNGIISTSVKSHKRDRLVLSVAPAAGLAGTSATISVAQLRRSFASWYGLYGEGLACGGTLGVNQIGVAHKTLPCGTKVTISYRGRTIVAPVIDRGPFIAGREFDLTGAAARALHFDGVDTIWVSP